MKKFMEKQRKKHLSLNLLQLHREEEEEGEEQLQELVLTWVLLMMTAETNAENV